MKKVRVDEVVSPGFGNRVIEGVVCAVTDLEQLEGLAKERPGCILAVPHLYWNDWFLNIGFLEKFDAVLANTGTSVLCHAAIIMREIDFVCITISDLFEQIEDGDRVRITIKRSSWQRILKDFFYNLRRRKHLLKYPRGAVYRCELVVLDRQ